MFRQLGFVPALLLCVLLAGILFLADLSTPLGLADGFLYLLIALLAVFFVPHHRAGLIVAAACTVLIVLGQFLSPPGEVLSSILNRFFAVAMLWMTALLSVKRMKAEVLVQAAEARFRAQYQGIPVPTYTWRYDGCTFRLIDHNRASDLFTRGRIREWVGRTFDQVFVNHPDLHADLIRCVTDRATIRRDMTHTMVSTGEEKELDVSYVFVPPDLVMVHTQDITDRRRAEQAQREEQQKLEQCAEQRGAWLREANELLLQEIDHRQTVEQEFAVGEAQLQSLVQNIPGAIYRCRCDAEWTAEFVSDEISSITGYPPSDFVENRVRSYASIIHPDDRATVNLAVQESIARHEPFKIEYRLCHADGTVRWVHEQGQAIEAGATPGLLNGIILDVTERKRIEAALSERNAMLATVYEVSDIAQKAPTFETACRMIADAVSRATGFEIAAIELYDVERQRMIFAGAVGMPSLGGEDSFEVSADDTLSGLVARTGTPLLETRAFDRDEYRHTELRRLGVETFLCIPLIAAGSTLGVLSLASPNRREVSSDVVQWMGNLAAQIATLIDRVKTKLDRERLIHDLGERVKELTLLHQVARLVQDLGRPVEDVMRDIAFLIPSAWEYPDLCAARITVDGVGYVSEHFAESSWSLTADIGQGDGKRGEITVVYHGLPDDRTEIHFLEEERTLLRTLAEQCHLYLSGRHAQDVLRKSQLRYQESARQTRLMLDALPVLVSYVDHEQRYQSVNEGYRRWFGLELEAVSGRYVWEVIGDAAYDHLKDRIEQALIGEPVEFEAEIPYASGGLRTVQASYLPHRATDGSVLGFYALIQDISARRKAEAALKRSEEQFRSVVAVLAEGVVVQDEDGTILACNPSAERILNFPAEQLIGRNSLDPRWKALREDGTEFPGPCHPPMETLRSGNPCEHVVMGLPRGNGVIIWIAVNTKPLFREGEKEPYGVVSSFIDITERKRAEAALQSLMEELEQRVEVRTLELREANDSLHAEMARRAWIEVALRKSKAGLAEAQRIAHIGSWELDLLTNELDWSPEIYRIFEIDPAQFPASYDAFLALVHPDDRAVVDDHYRESVRVRYPYEIVHRLLMADGRVKFVHERGETFYDHDGQPVRTIGTVQDVTERKQAEEALLRLQADLEARVKRRTDELLTVNRQLLVEIEERISAQHTLLRRDRILEAVSFAAKRFLLSSWSSERLIEVLHRLGDAASVDHVCVFQNGSDSRGDLSTSLVAEWVAPGIPSRRDDGRLQGLSYRGQGLQRWITVLSSGASISGIVHEWPEAEQVIMGIRGQRAAALVPIFVGEEWWGFIVLGLLGAERDWPAVEVDALQIAASTFGAGIQRRQMEEQIRRHTEDLEALVEQRTTRVKELESQRAQIEKLAAIGQLAAGVAHEINNPIAGIKNAFLILKDGIPQDFPHYRFVGMVEREIERVVRIVRQMYELYRTESGPQDRIALHMLLEDLSDVVEAQLGQRRLLLNWDALAATQKPHLVPRDLLQVLLNLIQNAIDVSPEHGSISLEVTRENGMICVKVADQGPGIAPEVLPHIFEPFYSQKKSDGLPGMGLGLSVCHSLVQAMGGWIEVRTEVGLGTTFTVFLPLPAGEYDTIANGGCT